MADINKGEESFFIALFSDRTGKPYANVFFLLECAPNWMQGCKCTVLEAFMIWIDYVIIAVVGFRLWSA